MTDTRMMTKRALGDSCTMHTGKNIQHEKKKKKKFYFG